MKKPVYILFVLIFAACGYNDFDAVTPENPEIPNPLSTIRALRALYDDGYVELNDPDLIISGRVTTSDRTNNFYRTFIIEDNTGAVEIRAGLYDLHNIFMTGQRVTVLTEGLCLGMDNGLLQIGRKSLQHYDVEYIDHAAILKEHVLSDNNIQTPVPRTLNIADLTDDMTGTLVTVNNLKLDYASDTTWALTAQLSPTGSPMSAGIKFKSSPIDSIYVFTSGYANFANEKVPHGEVDITGILLKNPINGRQLYQLKLRDLNDVEE